MTKQNPSGIFYIYVHRRLTDNSVFYVGKGKKKRAWSKSRRNQYWHNIVNKSGYLVEIIEENLNEQVAFFKETCLIDVLRQMNVNLCNLTDGGEGCSGFKFNEKQRKENSDRKVKLYDENQEVRKTISDSLKKFYMENPLSVESASSKRLKYYEDNPEVKVLLSEKKLQFYKDNPSLCAEHSTKIKEFYAAHPERVAEISKKKKEFYRDNPEVIASISLTLKKRYDDPAFRKANKIRQSKQHFLHLATCQVFYSYKEASRELGRCEATIKRHVLNENGYINYLKPQTETTCNSLP